MKNEKVEIYSALEVANMCGVVNQTAINWIKNGYLKAFSTPGGQYRVYYDDLVEFMKERGMRIPARLDKSTEKPLFNSLMIVDDDNVLNDALASFFKKNIPDLTIYQSFDGFNAGAQFVKHKPSFIILDIDLPGIDGKQICKNIKEDKSYNNPFVIIFTGLEDDDLEDTMYELGANAFFKKPVDFNEILNTINEVIG